MHPHIDDAAGSYHPEDFHLVPDFIAVVHDQAVVLPAVPPNPAVQVQVAQENLVVLPVRRLVDALDDVVDLESGNVLRNDAYDVAPAGPQRPGRDVGLVSQLPGCHAHLLRHTLADLVLLIVHHIGDRRRGNARPLRHILQRNHAVTSLSAPCPDSPEALSRLRAPLSAGRGMSEGFNRLTLSHLFHPLFCSPPITDWNMVCTKFAKHLF